MIQIVEERDPRWTLRHLEHLKKNQLAYGIKISENLYFEVFKNIEEGIPTERCETSSKCFNIFYKTEYIGDIVLAKTFEDDRELDIFVFDEYSGKGYTKKAVKKFLECYDLQSDKKLQAIVRDSNNHKPKVVNILESNGFVKISRTDDGDLFERLNREIINS